MRKMLRKLCKPRTLTALVTTRMSVVIEAKPDHVPTPFAITFRENNTNTNTLYIKTMDGIDIKFINAILDLVKINEDDEAAKRLYIDNRTKTTKPFEDFIADVCDAFMEDFYKVEFTLPMSDARKMKSLVKMGREDEARDVYKSHIKTTGGLRFAYFKKFYCN